MNALRHGTSAPAITERATVSRVTLTVSIAVADPTTIDVDRLFERFYQADASRATAGSGLGLSVAANLAHAMGMGIDAHLEGNMLSVTLDMGRAGS